MARYHPLFGNSAKTNTNDTEQLMRELKDLNIEIISVFSILSPIGTYTFQCNQCQHTWSNRINLVLGKKSLCPNCATETTTLSEANTILMKRGVRILEETPEMLRVHQFYQFGCKANHTWQDTLKAELMAKGCRSCTKARVNQSRVGNRKTPSVPPKPPWAK